MNARQLLFALAIAAGAAGCSGGSADPSDTTSSTSTTRPGSAGPVNPNVTGSIHLALTLPGGESIAQVAWAISGPNAVSTLLTSGSETVNALAVNFLVGSIPAASGYRVTLSGSSSTGVTCTGGANFNVTARETTTVAVAMACSSAPAGSVGTLVNGETYDCAALTGVTASPTTLSVGGSVTLTAMADAPSTANLTYAWSAPSGSFSSTSSPQSSFQCTAPGTVPLTVVVADGPLPDGAVCNPATTTMTITITCTGVASDGGTGGGGMADSGTGGGGTVDGGGSHPPPVVPATPPWALAMLCAVLVGLGLKRRGATGSA
jgi:hypothetical protein